MCDIICHMSTQAERTAKYRQITTYARENGLERVPKSFVTLYDPATGEMVTYDTDEGESTRWAVK